MSRPTLHLLGIPHTITSREFSHCAFTGKVLRFAPMMRPHGYRVVHYGTEGSTSGADLDVPVMSLADHRALLGHEYHVGRYASDAEQSSPLYRQWNHDVRDALREHTASGDLILLPFGHAHAAAIRNLDILAGGSIGVIESGIGYLDCFSPWRIYESEAVRHTVMAIENRHVVRRIRPHIEMVAPNYYDPADWPEGPGGDALVFAGRLVVGKGLALILALAAHRPDREFWIAGQGNINDWPALPRNVKYVGVLGADTRAAFFGSARAILAPSLYVEPFCGVVVEAAFCGTPAITSPFGAFTETVQEGVTGYRPLSLSVEAWSDAIDALDRLDRGVVAARARALYSTERVGALYDSHFQTFASVLRGRNGFPNGEWNA